MWPLLIRLYFSPQRRDERLEWEASEWERIKASWVRCASQYAEQLLTRRVLGEGAPLSCASLVWRQRGPTAL